MNVSSQDFCIGKRLNPKCTYSINNVIVIGRFQKISIPIPRTAFRISEGEGGSLNWNSEGMGGIYNWKSEGKGDFTGGISGVERVESVPLKR